MGGCCSAQGTANGSVPAPGAPAQRDRAKSATAQHPAEPKAPAKAPGTKAPPAKKEDQTAAAPAASPSKAPAPAIPSPQPPPEVKKPADVPVNEAPAKLPAPPAEIPKKTPPPSPAVAAAAAPPPAPSASSSAHAGPPSAQSDHLRQHSTTTPPAVPLIATQEERNKPTGKSGEALPSPKAGESSDAHPGNSTSSTVVTNAFPSLAELKATPPPPPALDAPESAEKAAAVEFSLPPPPAAVTVSPVSLTPERAPQLTPHEGEGDDDPTRGPSTARVEEVPPTPARDSDVAACKALPADDARVLQRVPPPPPLPMLSAATPVETPKENPPEKAAAAEAEEVPANPLAEILRRQQEEKERYPTALTTDAADDAPLEISMEDDKAGAAAAAWPRTGADKYVTVDAEDVASAANHTEAKVPLAEPGTVITFADGDPCDKDAARGDVVFKVLQHSEWEELCESGELHSSDSDGADECIRLATADQALAEMASLQLDGTAPLVLICCTIAALSKPGADVNGGGAPLRWESDTQLGQRTPRLYRSLQRGSDILWYQECANASEAAERLRKEAVVSDTASEAASKDAEAEVAAAGGDGNAEPEKMVFKGDEDDMLNKPISFTDTSEIERQLAERVGADDNNMNREGDTTPRMSPPAEQNNNSSIDMPNAAHADVGRNDNDSSSDDHDDDLVSTEKKDEGDWDDDAPHPIVRDVVRDIALPPPAGESLEARRPAPHAVSAMTQAPEAAPVSPREAQSASAPPRRVPPPLPSPPAEPLNAAENSDKAEVKNGESTPPPSRQPPPILSPPPV
jgi:uncharacterized protein (DUF952 family)